MSFSMHPTELQAASFEHMALSFLVYERLPASTGSRSIPQECTIAGLLQDFCQGGLASCTFTDDDHPFQRTITSYRRCAESNGSSVKRKAAARFEYCGRHGHDADGMQRKRSLRPF